MFVTNDSVEKSGTTNENTEFFAVEGFWNNVRVLSKHFESYSLDQSICRDFSWYESYPETNCAAFQYMVF